MPNAVHFFQMYDLKEIEAIKTLESLLVQRTRKPFSFVSYPNHYKTAGMFEKVTDENGKIVFKCTALGCTSG